MKIELSKSQFRAFTSQALLLWMAGGVGSGKTFLGALWATEQALKFPKIVGFIGANTYRQLTQSTLPPLFDYCRKRGLDYRYGRKPPEGWNVQSHFEFHEGIISFPNGCQILTYSLENYTAFRGIQVGWAWLDETADTHPDAVKILFERLRGFDGLYPDHRYLVRVTGTPNGFDHLYDMFVNPGTKLPDSECIQVHTKENAVNQPKDYAENLEKRLGKKLARQQLAAQFVSLTAGRVFEFDRAKHCKPCEYDPALPLIWSMDFNVAPMAGLVMQIHDKDVKVIDEVCIEDDAQTRDAVNEFGRRYGDKSRAVLAWGDMAGRHRDTRGTESDIEIMIKTLRQHFGSVKDAQDYAQRFVVDGVNAVNSLFDHGNLAISPRCERLMQDLEQMAWKPGTKEIEKERNKTLTHFGDALRYPLAQMFEIGQVTFANKSFAKGFF